METINTLDKATLPPGPNPSLLKILFPDKKNDLLKGLLKNREQYGDVTFAKIGPISNYTFFSHEDAHYILVTNQKNYVKGVAYNSLAAMVGRGLVTSDGDLWKRQRRLMGPHFTPVAVLDFSEMMAKSIEHMLDAWVKAAEQNQPLHMDLEMMNLTMNIIGQALFSFDIGSAPTDIGMALQDAFAFSSTRSVNPIIPLWVPLPEHRRFYHNLKIIDQFLYDQIAEGRRHSERQNFLSTMLKVVDSETGQGMSDQQLRDEVITLFFAGFETTTRTLAWAWYSLSKHPEVMEKLRNEADRVLENGSPSGGADLERLTYSRMVIDETLRLYPPTALLARQNVEADEIGGYKIPPMTLVSISPYVIHRSPEYFPDPERFDPERFTAENSAGRPKSAYIPFSGGPRVCIGNSFSLMEMIYTLSMVVKRFDLKPVTDDEITAVFTGTVRPSGPLYMQASLRK